MHVFETNDPVEAQRCRRAKYVDFPTAITLGGSIALWLDMPRPYWAMASVYITSNPLTGATRTMGA
jgi:hypothetical protein